MKHTHDLHVTHKIYDSDECMEVLEDAKNRCKERYLDALAHFQWTVDSFVSELEDSAECDAYLTKEENCDNGSYSATVKETFDDILHEDLLMVINNSFETARHALAEYRQASLVLATHTPEDEDSDNYMEDEGRYLEPDDDEIEDTDDDYCHCEDEDDDNDGGRFKKRTRFKRRFD